MNEGWCWPVASRKAHYFKNGRSLCNRWMYFGQLDKNQKTGTAPGPDDCRECHSRLVKERSKVGRQNRATSTK